MFNLWTRSPTPTVDTLWAVFLVTWAMDRLRRPSTPRPLGSHGTASHTRTWEIAGELTPSCECAVYKYGASGQATSSVSIFNVKPTRTITGGAMSANEGDTKSEHVHRR